METRSSRSMKANQQINLVGNARYGQMKSRKPIARSSKPIPRSPLKRSQKPIPKLGKKGKASKAATKKATAEHANKGRVRCENCFSEFGAANAHRFKRLDIKTKTELETTVILCAKCHFHVDFEMSHEEMKETLDRIIAGREERYWAPC